MIGLMRSRAASMGASVPSGSGADVEKVLGDVKILDVVVIGEFADELELGPDHGLVAPLDPAEIGQGPAAGLVLRPLAGLAVIGLCDLFGLEGGLEQVGDARFRGERDADRRRE